MIPCISFNCVHAKVSMDNCDVKGKLFRSPRCAHADGRMKDNRGREINRGLWGKYMIVYMADVRGLQIRSLFRQRDRHA